MRTQLTFDRTLRGMTPSSTSVVAPATAYVPCAEKERQGHLGNLDSQIQKPAFRW